MTESLTGTGAVSHIPTQWSSIDWASAERIVRRLQARIVKATQAGRWGKVKALQHLLTHSYSGKVLAVRRVTENDGRKTPGVDGLVWNTPDKKMCAVQVLKRRGYRPQPLRRMYIPKSNGKMRPLGIPTMHDRAMQALYLLGLDPIAESTADPNSYGFRKRRCCADAMVQCHTVLSNRYSAQWVLEADIKSCFDRISHEWLAAHIPMDTVVLSKWLAAGYMEQSVWYETEEGTPQGGVISPALANMTLDGLEARLRRRYPANTEKSRAAQVNLIRYADDFLITGRTKALLEDEIKPLVEEFLGERGLELSVEKTSITHITDGLNFLGEQVRKYNGKLLITPSKRNVKTFLDNIRKVIRRNAQVATPVLIAQLNSKIRGWANFHRHVASKRTFSHVDHAIFKAVWQWAVRRHPNKSRHWVKEKYFGTQGGQHWAFFGVGADVKGRPVTYWLLHSTSVPIRRYRKIKGKANPYDPAWASYFAQRDHKRDDD